MSDKSINSSASSGKSSTNSFDLDSFLQENNFLPSDGTHVPTRSKTVQAKPTAPKTALPAAPTMPGAAAMPSAFATDAPSVPVTVTATPALARTDRPTQSKPQSVATTDKTRSDPNATVSYDAALVEAPGPISKDPHTKTRTPKQAAVADPASVSKQDAVASHVPMPKQALAVGPVQATKPTSAPGPRPDARSQDARSQTGNTLGKTKKSATAQGKAVRKGTGKMAAVKTKSKPTSKRARLKTFANPKDFHQANISSNSYQIRGGGAIHNKRSPILIVTIAAICLIAVVFVIYLMSSTISTISHEEVDAPVFTLSSTETRAAIDEQMPRMFDLLPNNVTDSYNALSANGWTVYANEQLSEDGTTATGNGQIVRLLSSVSADILTDYYATEFNAFDYTQIQDYYNGAWFYTISHGEQGDYSELSYINIASTASATQSDPLMAELEHMMELQGFNAEGTVVLSKGLDQHENTYIEGYITSGETRYFWKLACCPLSGYYQGEDSRDIPDNAIFVKVKLASFNFDNVEIPADTGTGTGAGADTNASASGGTGTDTGSGTTGGNTDDA